MKKARKAAIVWCALFAFWDLAGGADLHIGDMDATGVNKAKARTVQPAGHTAPAARPSSWSSTAVAAKKSRAAASASADPPGTPWSPGLGLGAADRFVSLPPLPNSAVDEAYQKNKREGRARLQIGIGRSFAQPLAVNPKTTPGSAWTTLTNGWRVLLVDVRSEGAVGLRLHLQNLHLSAGTRLVVYDPSNPSPDPSPITANNVSGQPEVWTHTLFSSDATIEAQVPPETDLKSLAFTVTEVSHLYSLPVSGGILKEGTCHKDVTCYPDYATQASGVARMSYLVGGNAFVCSGCLIASSVSGTSANYFLTANHCVGAQGPASTVELFWFYQTSTCNGAPPNLATVPTTAGGADLLATSDVNDFTLLRLHRVPPAGTFHLTWSTAAPDTNETLACIEHPTGSYKRICFGNLVGSDPDFWGVQWDSGVTEDGSSGSPLLNGNHDIIGQLNGGFEGPGSSCSNPSAPDQFGRFDVTYKAVKSWLGSGGGPGDFTTVKGTYSGLFSDVTNDVSVVDAGFFSLTINGKGRFSGRLVFAGTRSGFVGQLDGNGAAEVKIFRRFATSLTLDLQIDPADSDHITGMLTDGNWVASLDGDHAVFDGRQSIPPQFGRYTMVISGSGDSTNGAGGDSFGVVNVTKAGRIQMAGSLSDGTSVSQAATISKNGRWPLFQALSGGHGLIFSWASFGDSSDTNSVGGGLSGDVTWIRPPLPRAKVYPAGFATQTSLTGSAYTVPLRGSDVLNFSDATTVTLGGGGLSQTIADQVSIGPFNRMVNQKGSPVVITFSPINGRFSGNALNPDTNKRIPFRGVVLQGPNTASGYFFNGTESGQTVISP